MNPIVHAFSERAYLYDKNRWDYSTEAIEKIYNTTRLNKNSTIAEIGSGTGILTKHFIHSVARLYCVEPSEGMRLFAVQRFSNNIEFVSVDGSSESTKLLTNSINIILVGQALHYFNSEQTLMEFQRICIPHGWLATLAIVLADKELEKATKGIFTENNGCNVRLSLYKPQKVPINYYFPNGCTRYTYSHIHEETFEQFLGGLCSSADAPLISNPLFVNFKRDARKIFDSFRISEDKISIPLYTQLSLGQLNA